MSSREHATSGNTDRGGSDCRGNDRSLRVSLRGTVGNVVASSFAVTFIEKGVLFLRGYLAACGKTQAVVSMPVMSAGMGMAASRRRGEKCNTP